MINKIIEQYDDQTFLTADGFDEAIISEELALVEQGLVPSVLLTLGFRSENDFNAKLPKSRLAKEEIFTKL